MGKYRRENLGKIQKQLSCFFALYLLSVQSSLSLLSSVSCPEVVLVLSKVWNGEITRGTALTPCPSQFHFPGQFTFSVSFPKPLLEVYKHLKHRLPHQMVQWGHQWMLKKWFCVVGQNGNGLYGSGIWNWPPDWIPQFNPVCAGEIRIFFLVLVQGFSFLSSNRC